MDDRYGGAEGSVLDGAHSDRELGRRGAPPRAQLYVIALAAVALAATGWGVAVDATWEDARFLAALAVGGMVVIETSRLTAGGRRSVAGRVQWGYSAWPFAAAVLVRPNLAGLVTVPLYVHGLFRAEEVRVQKWLASGAVVTVSAWAAGSLFTWIVGSPLRAEGSPSQFGAIVAAIVVYLVLEALLFFVRSRLNAAGETQLRARLRTRDYYTSELAVLATGAVAAVLCRYWLGFLILVIPVVVAQQRAWLYLPLKQETLRDPKTQLLTSQAWRRAAKASPRERGEGRYAVLFIDLDHFKAVNDGYGHVVGDEVLINVAGELKRLTRPIDLVGRYGGEEFCVLLPDTEIETALDVAERLRSGIATLRFSTTALRVTVSVGVAVARPGETDDADLDELVLRADRALYTAKGAGRDCVRVWGAADEGGEYPPPNSLG
jgi:diguanylate cyclase (GGDEF)-like protein